MPKFYSPRRRPGPIGVLLIIPLIPLALGGCGGCRSETPPKPAPPTTTAASTSQVAPTPWLPSPPRTVAELEPKRQLEPRVIQKYFLTSADKPIIPYSRPKPYTGNFFVDTASGKLAWKAMICTAPDCPSHEKGKEPILFGIRHAALYPLPNGETPNLFDDQKGPQVCPFCGRYSTIQEYLPPSDQEKISQLKIELQQAYAAQHEALAQGRTATEGYRPPGVIIQEMNSIPRHYLLDKDMVYPPAPDPNDNGGLPD